MLYNRSSEDFWLSLFCRVFLMQDDLWVLIRCQMTRWCNLQTKVFYLFKMLDFTQCLSIMTFLSCQLSWPYDQGGPERQIACELTK